jgi:hypothetical protein
MALSHAGQGVDVDLYVYVPPGDGQHAPVYRVQRQRIHIVVISIHGDLPMRAKFMRCSGHSAYLHCPYCWTTQTSCAENNHTTLRACGYSEEAEIERGLHQDRKFSMSRLEEHRRTEQQLRDAAALTERERNKVGGTAEHVREAQSIGGMKGKSCLVRLLYYLQYTTSFMIPFMHTCFRGAFRDFMLAVIPAKLNPAPRTPHVFASGREEMKHRMSTMVLTSDFNRAGRDPVQGLKQYTMEELAHLCLTWLPLLWFEV